MKKTLLLPRSLRCALLLLGALVFVSSRATPTSPYLELHLVMSGSDPAAFRTTNPAGAGSDSTAGSVGNIFVSADYGKLVVNTDAVVPSDPATNLHASVSGYAKWVDTLDFTPTDPLLIGTAAKAHFTLSLTGTYVYGIAAGASPAEGSYEVDGPTGTIATGDFSFGGSLTHGEQDISHYATISFDQNFTVGTRFEVALFLTDGIAIQSVDGASSSAHIDLTLTNTGLTALDNSSAPIDGSFSTFSGHDYTVAAIPEPTTYAALAGVAALGLAVLRRRRVGT